MFVKITKKQMYKKCVLVLICLLIFGNLTRGSVVCFGADGHVEIESAFHEHCDDHGHSQPAGQKQLSDQPDHVKGKHCEPCIDIQISIDLAKPDHVSKELNCTPPVPTVIVVADKFNLSAYASVSNTFAAASYFTPLDTVILLI